MRVLGHGQEEADDLIQEALLRILQEVHLRGEPNNPKAWLCRVIRNLSNTMRRRPVPTSIEEEESERTEAALVRDRSQSDLTRLPENQVEHEGLIQAMREAAGSLPPRQQHALALYYAGGLSIRDIAAILGDPENTVKTWLSRARASIMKTLQLQGWCD
jgi:RNA polymerase sigma-70 factor (ECF subfamily)